MKNKPLSLSTLLDAIGRPRKLTIQASLVLLQVIALPLTRASDPIAPEKTAGDLTARPLPPAEQRVFNKTAATETLGSGPTKQASGPVVSGVLPSGAAQFDKKSAAGAAILPVRSAANLPAGPVSGQASAEDLKNYQKPGGNSTAPSVLVLPVSAPEPGAGKVAVGTVFGPASPKDLRGYVKPAVLPGTAPEPGAGKAVVGKVSGPASPEDLRGYVKPASAASGAPSQFVSPVSGLPPGARKVAVGTGFGPASPEELRGYVKPAALPGVAPEPARAPSSGTLPAAEIKPVQK